MRNRLPRLVPALLLCLIAANSETGRARQSPDGPRHPTQVVVSSSVNPATAGAPLTVTADVAAVLQAGTTPSGEVEFFDAVTSIGVAAIQVADGRARASLTLTTLAEGAHPISAEYRGDSQHFDSRSTPLLQIVAPPAQ